MFQFINGRLSIGLRLTLAAAFFIASAAVSAALLYMRGDANTEFSRKEFVGTQYNTVIWQSLQSGDGTPVTDHEGYDAQFSSADAYTAFAAAHGWNDRVAKAAALIVAVADGSNLTLDPDLDSYYAMDAATVKLPNLLNMSLALNAAMALPPDSVDRKIKIATALDRFSAASDAAFGSMDTSMKNNASGLTKAALSQHREALQAAVDAMKKAAQAELDSAASSDYKATSSAFPAVLSNAWSATNSELARIIDVRVTKLFNQQISDLTTVIVLVLLSALLTLVITLGLSRRFRGLDEAMTRLNQGDKTVEVPYLDDRNETGRIAATLEKLKTSMIERESAEQRIHLQEVEMVVSSFGEGLAALAQGDLSARIDRSVPADYRNLCSDFNDAMGSISRAMEEVENRVADIASSAAQMNDAAGEMAGRTESQAGALEQTSVSMQQIVDTVNQSAIRAKEVYAAAQTARGHAERGSHVAQQTKAAMSSIEESSKQITDIIGVIDEIAFQTNLLALNAGVEAARAGEAGKGFAVVAMEVRELAGRSAESAKQIKALIKTSEQQVIGGVSLVEQSGAELARIFEDIGQITDSMNEIAESGRQQATVLAEVNKAVSQIDQATQQNAALAEESRACSSTLADFARELATVVGKFRLRKTSGNTDCERFAA